RTLCDTRVSTTRVLYEFYRFSSRGDAWPAVFRQRMSTSRGSKRRVLPWVARRIFTVNRLCTTVRRSLTVNASHFSRALGPTSFPTSGEVTLARALASAAAIWGRRPASILAKDVSEIAPLTALSIYA